MTGAIGAGAFTGPTGHQGSAGITGPPGNSITGPTGTSFTGPTGAGAFTGPTGAAVGYSGISGASGNVAFNLGGGTGPMMQWGTTPSANTGTFSIVFNPAFPTACDIAVATNGVNATDVTITSITNTGVKFSLVASGGNQLYWFAIGH